MGFFNWSAPAIRRYGERWTADNVQLIVGWIRPFVPGGGHILDVGGGAGGLARRITEALPSHVTVLDPTPELIDHVETSEHVSAVLGSAETMPFEDDEFDAVVVTDAFHHFRDPDGAVAEMARVVRPGGAVLVLELDRSRLMIKMIAIAERLVGEPASFFTPSGLCTFMAKRRIEGECERLVGASYRFLGVVRKPWPAA
ncbi:MAG: methyltransferase domain-containing protein [Coriobacteriia bacterium]|nr:methyltransferase domain-containing protein [Coriobacteriia bacterium]